MLIRLITKNAQPKKLGIRQFLTSGDPYNSFLSYNLTVLTIAAFTIGLSRLASRLTHKIPGIRYQAKVRYNRQWTLSCKDNTLISMFTHTLNVREICKRHISIFIHKSRNCNAHIPHIALQSEFCTGPFSFRKTKIHLWIFDQGTSLSAQ